MVSESNCTVRRSRSISFITGRSSSRLRDLFGPVALLCGYAVFVALFTVAIWKVGAARLAGLSILGDLRRELGDLDRVVAWLRVFGMVNSGPGFVRQPNVVNGFSDLVPMPATTPARR
jgi:hypothetical protein